MNCNFNKNIIVGSFESIRRKQVFVTEDNMLYENLFVLPKWTRDVKMT